MQTARKQAEAQENRDDRWLSIVQQQAGSPGHDVMHIVVSGARVVEIRQTPPLPLDPTGQRVEQKRSSERFVTEWAAS